MKLTKLKEIIDHLVEYRPNDEVYIREKNGKLYNTSMPTHFIQGKGDQEEQYFCLFPVSKK